MPEAIFFSYMALIRSTDTTPALTPEQPRNCEQKTEHATELTQPGKT